MLRQVFVIFLSVVLAAGAGVVTDVFTAGWGWAWGVALGVLVVTQTVAQVWLWMLGREEPTVGAPGSGAVSGPVTGGTVVTGGHSVGRVDGGTVVIGDGNVVGEGGVDRW